MDKKRIKKAALGAARDVGLAFLVVVIIMGALLAYCRVWPPVVVVESGSMMHSMESQIGIIDTGDMVLVKYSPDIDDVVTYALGETTGHRTYGEYGDVIIYRPDGSYNQTPIIHRAIVWLELNESQVHTFPSGDYDYANCAFDAPVLGIFGESIQIIMPDYGFKERDVIINVEGIIENFERVGSEPHSGYITMGDGNSPIYDQKPSGYLLVKPEWVVGKAFGELPWFGLIKLTITGELNWGDAPPNSWTNLIISIIIILGIPLFIDFGLPRLKRKKDGNGEDADGGGSDDTSPGAEAQEGPGKEELGESTEERQSPENEKGSEPPGEAPKVPTEVPEEPAEVKTEVPVETHNESPAETPVETHNEGPVDMPEDDLH